MQIYHDPETVLPRPLEGTKNVRPTRAGEERFALPHVDSPVGDRQSDPIQPCAGDLGKIYFGLDGKRGKENAWINGEREGVAFVRTCHTRRPRMELHTTNVS
jgi:hypothetical protein